MAGAGTDGAGPLTAASNGTQISNLTATAVAGLSRVAANATQAILASAVEAANATSPGQQEDGVVGLPLVVSNISSADTAAHVVAAAQVEQHFDPNIRSHHGNPMFNHRHRHLPKDPTPVTTLLTFYAILICMVSAQTGLFWWKKNHKRSYELVTLLGLWLFPAITCIFMHFWRFLLVWSLFTATTCYLASLCLATPMDRGTPRKVYTWFLLLYKVSVAVGSTGYFLLLAFYFLEVFGLHHLVHDVISKIITPSAAVLWIWYGLYFGIMGRDSAELCADMMSRRLGTGRKLSVSINNCGICTQELRDFTHLGEAAASTEGYEKTVQLACKHLFHSGCIRGWTIVGKKDTCPVCNEKVDLRALYVDRPWESRNLSWIQMLDAIRYMVVWNPLILIALHTVFTFLGLDKHDHNHQQVHTIPLGSSQHPAPL